MNSSKLSELAEVAFASYVDHLSVGRPRKDVLKGAPDMDRMADRQASAFADNFEVTLPTYHDAYSGLDVTVFKAADNSLTLGIRGTQELAVDLLDADADIATKGAAYKQIVALYNWWQRVSASASNTAVKQFSVQELIVGQALPSGAELLYVKNSTNSTVWGYLVPLANVNGSGELVGALADDPDRRIDVAGHSLGGHLAIAFNALFPGVTGEVAVFNAPGFRDSDANNRFFKALGGDLPNNVNNSNVTNVIADEAHEGTQPFGFIAGLNSRPGNAIDISIENQLSGSEPAKDLLSLNHSMKILGDSLAVYALLNTLSTDLSTSLYKSLLQAAANTSAGSYEGLVGALRSILTAKTEALPVGNDQRDALYQALDDLKHNEVFNGIAGKVTIKQSSADLGQEARNDFSALASLITLSPVALTANDAASKVVLDEALKSVWGQTFEDWESDKTLNEDAIKSGEGAFTNNYLVDRAAMLSWLVERNIKDTDSTTLIVPGTPASMFREYQGTQVVNRDRKEPRGPSLPHHRTYGSRIRRFGLLNACRESC